MSNRLAFLLVVAFFFAGCGGPAERAVERGPGPIHALLLGHASEHHNSAAYYPILARALALEGIHLSYVEDPAEALTPETLGQYDALLLYANHDSITTDQERALLDYVADGHAFVPIHSASFCFRNSDAFVELVGGQFESHETGTFTAEIVAPDHPAMEGVEPFETWDETYVHSRHGDDRTILMERVEGDHREPYTWTRTHGDGRVFYTAYGHDERTWSHPGFQRLVAQGILWAVDDDVRELWAQYGPMPELVYADAKLPNYEQRDPPPRMQQALSPEESMKLIQVPPGFRLELFAAEPDIINPITFAFDERGRLWVVETVDYPNTVRGGEPGDDKIKILEDTDGDGRADKVTVFADSLNIPTSLTFANDGVIVAQAPDFLFLQDTDGDDRADVREVIMTGWGTFDTHAGPSNLQYGFDNKIWGTVGYASYEGLVGGDTLRFRQGFYRFDPDGSNLEYLARTSNNTWGLGFSEAFDVFGSTANNAPSWYMGIPERAFDGVEGIARPMGSRGIADFYAIHPLTPNIRQVDVHGGYTAAAGHHLYTARAYPESYWNRVALIAEPTGHLLARGYIEPDGAGFVTKDGRTLLASADEWVSPVHAQVGPDGAVWVADWYNFIVQHNPTPQGFDNGEGNAYVTDLRDRSHGRIYRIVYEAAAEAEPRALSKDDPAGLVDALGDDNLFWRLHAQRLLVERGETDVVDDLIDLVGDRGVDAVGINGGATHALWTLHGLGQLSGSNAEASEAALAALDHPAPGVRKTALQVLPSTAGTRDALLEADLLNDGDPHTRLAAILALAEMPSSDEAGAALYALSKDAAVYEDPFLSQATYVASVAHGASVQQAYAADPQAVPAEALSAGLRMDADDTPMQRLGPDAFQAWPTLSITRRWEGQGGDLDDLDGRVWVLTTVEGTTSGAATLHLGTIDDNDVTWVNGVRVGATNGYDEERVYRIPADVWQTGTNVIAVRVHDSGAGGGFYGDDPARVRVVESGGRTTTLPEDWHYRIEAANRGGLQYGAPGELAAHVVFHHGDGAGRSVDPAADAGEAEVVRELGVIPDQLKYDKAELTVAAGQTVEIVFSNPDAMQHNIVIGTPGSLETIGAAADQLAQSPTGAEQQYVPDIPEVLFATDLVDPGQTIRFRFTAPDEPGDYTFICTFPGHWRLMNGVLHVVRVDA